MASIFPDTSVNNPETGFGWKDGDVWYDPDSGITYVWYNPVWKTGSIDNIGASVEVGDTAPVAPEVGDLWWKTPDNLLYVWYSDDDSDQWVIASPPLNINTDLFVETTGDNMTGDLTLGTDKITLDATTGTGTFAGQVTTGDSSGDTNTSGVGIGEPGYVSISQSDRQNQNCLSVADTTTQTTVFSVTGAGSAQFAGQVTANQSFFSQPDAGYSGIYVYGDNTSEAEALVVRPANNQDVSAQINFNGSAKFASNSASGEDPSLLLTQNNPNGNFLTCKNGSTGGNTIQFGVTGTASFAGRTRTNWFTCDSATKNVSASGNAVLTILGDNPGFCTVYIAAKYAANGALQSHFDYELITCDSTNNGGATAIRTMFNGSVGSFQVSASDFAVTRSNSNTIITYTNQASGSNFITFYVKGNFRSMSIV